MTFFYLGTAVALILTLALGLIRVFIGPSTADRLLSAQLFGTTGVAISILLYAAGGSEAFINVALIFVLLSSITLIAYAVYSTKIEYD